jgi:hypothetical protein
LALMDQRCLGCPGDLERRSHLTDQGCPDCLGDLTDLMGQRCPGCLEDPMDLTDLQHLTGQMDLVSVRLMRIKAFNEKDDLLLADRYHSR